jgi:hypothetical protein
VDDAEDIVVARFRWLREVVGLKADRDAGHAAGEVRHRSLDAQRGLRRRHHDGGRGA